MLTELAKLVQGDRIHFGKRLMRIEEHDNKVFLHFKDGTSASADCLIGADGIRSTTRKYLLGEDHPATAPTDQGWIFFRRMVPMEEAGKTVDPQLLNKVPIYCGERGAIVSHVSSTSHSNVLAIAVNTKHQIKYANLEIEELYAHSRRTHIQYNRRLPQRPQLEPRRT